MTRCFRFGVVTAAAAMAVACHTHYVTAPLGKEPAAPWATAIGNGTDDKLMAMAALPDRSVVVAGSLNYVLRLTGGSPGAGKILYTKSMGNLYVARISPDKRVLWAHAIESFDAIVYQMVVSRDSIWILGDTNTARTIFPSSSTLKSTRIEGGWLFAACYGFDGTLRYVERLGHSPSSGTTAGAAPHSGFATVEGGLVVAGEFRGGLFLPSNPNPIPVEGDQGSNSKGGYIARYRADGHLEWLRAYSVEGGLDRVALAPARDGDFFLVGSGQGRVHLGSATGVDVGTQGVNAKHGLFLARLDSRGQTRWCRVIGETDRALAMELISFEDDLILGLKFTGRVRFGIGQPASIALESNGISAALARIDATGNVRWGKTLPGYSVAIARSGSSFVTAFDLLPRPPGNAPFELVLKSAPDKPVTLASAGQSDVVLTRLDGHGDFLEVTRLGGRGDEHVIALQSQGDGSIFVAGEFSRTLLLIEGDHGDLALHSAGGTDSWVVFYPGPALPVTPQGQLRRIAKAKTLSVEGEHVLTAGKLEEACRLFTRACTLDTEESVYPMHLAQCLEKSGHASEAVAAYFEAIRLSFGAGSREQRQVTLREDAYFSLERLRFEQSGTAPSHGSCNVLSTLPGCRHAPSVCAWSATNAGMGAISPNYLIRIGSTADAATPPSEGVMLRVGMYGPEETTNTSPFPLQNSAEADNPSLDLLVERNSSAYRRCHEGTVDCDESGEETDQYCRLFFADACSGLVVAKCSDSNNDASSYFVEGNIIPADVLRVAP